MVLENEKQATEEVDGPAEADKENQPKSSAKYANSCSLCTDV